MKRNIIHKNRKSIAAGGAAATAVAYAADHTDKRDSAYATEESTAASTPESVMPAAREQKAVSTRPQNPSEAETGAAHIVSDEHGLPSAGLSVPASGIEPSPAVGTEAQDVDETDFGTTDNGNPENNIEEAATYDGNLQTDEDEDDGLAADPVEDEAEDDGLADLDNEKVVWTIVDEPDDIDMTDETSTPDITSDYDDTDSGIENDPYLVDKADDLQQESKGESGSSYDDNDLPDFDNQADVSMF